VLLHVNNNGVPIYLQIMEQVKGMIQSGRLVAGQELPAIRSLAEQLLINPNTVARAYLELENQNLITKKHGSGTFVSESAEAFGKEEQLENLMERLREVMEEAARLGISTEDLIQQMKGQSKKPSKKTG
jgi:GntR family transcriptional regulator